MKKLFSLLINIYKKYGNLFQGKCFYAFILFYKHQREWGTGRALKYVLKEFPHIHVIKGRDKVSAIGKMLEKVRIRPGQSDSLFVYPVDECVTLKLKGKILGNCCVDYSKIIGNSLEDLKMNEGEVFSLSNDSLIGYIESFTERIIASVGSSELKNKDLIIRNLQDTKTKKADTLEGALQRILLINAIQWQTGHILVGLGRLDLVLDRFSDDKRTDEELKGILKDFLRNLHEYYCLKSNALMGDTGQIIILGGNTEDGGYFTNRFTGLFLDAVKELDLPDPKVLIRISSKTPDQLWEKITDLIMAENGSPLISNDDVVIPCMLEFGYSKEEAYGYTTSACWEPMPGEGCEQNNIVSINCLEAFDIISGSIKEKEPDSFEAFMDLYFDGLEKHVKEILDYIDGIEWEEDPVISLFNSSARSRHMDAACGGGRSNNYGLLTVAMGNAVNSIMNIKKLVYEDHIFSLQELDRIRRSNFKGRADVRELLSGMPKMYGTDDPAVVSMVNMITGRIRKMVSEYRNRFNGRVKIGLSSPHYIMNSTDYPASFDGRGKGDPFAVHISNDHASDHIGLISFAAGLDYGNAGFNGNVVDMLVSPALINDTMQREKFIYMLRQGFKQGMFQLQLNCISADELRKAKANPEDFPDLIVRVWGFNAYFVQLPEEYQDYLIERAERYERAS
ncbi:MAG: hypothetical protein K6F86_13265 [Lachnospiraceae bacterium]|nr:hypothetical protein [Lachnospiraceae bacterium]